MTVPLFVGLVLATIAAISGILALAGEIVDRLYSTFLIVFTVLTAACLVLTAVAAAVTFGFWVSS